MTRLRTILIIAGALLAPLTGGGCFPHPFSMGFATPIPVQPWVPDRIEEQYIRSDYDTPVMPPIPPGYVPLCEDPPDRATILRAMPRVARGIPYVYEEFRDDIDFTVERLVDSVDPPRFYPLVGPAQLHHCHYKCTVFYTETLESCVPFPFKVQRRRVETVYIDRDHLHVVACTPEAMQSMYRDMTINLP